MTGARPAAKGKKKAHREPGGARAAELAGRIRAIREDLSPRRIYAVDMALQGLERELMAMSDPSARKASDFSGSCLNPGSPAPFIPGAEAMERSIRTRNLIRFILHAYSLQVQAGQRASTYSKQDCLDDMESLLETLLEWLSAPPAQEGN